MNPRYLTKSRFKLALECPVKLYYTGKRDVYYDTKFDNDFLAALAEGGFQVGELAKCYYPDGININDLDYGAALTKTKQLLKEKNVVIYEAAFIYENLFIRADIIEKKGNHIRLIEVKAKSFDPTSESFSNKNGILSKWKPYLYDIAFQKYVIQKSCPEYTVSSYLLLSDKSARATVDGLNQLFFISEENGRYLIRRPVGFDANKLGQKLLSEQPVDDLCETIYNDANIIFEDLVHQFSRQYADDQPIPVILGAYCGKCEFKPNPSILAKGFKSGFNECWNITGIAPERLDQGSLLNLWDFRKKADFIDHGKYLLSDLSREDLEPKTKGKKATIVPGLSRTDRQWLQVEKFKQDDRSPYIDKLGLLHIMKSWVFPLHFIDFETTALAIPFNAGRRPYEQTAFQFSHHIVQEDGSITHIGEWINLVTGAFPNFEFVRALKKELSKDEGTIFRYANHENTILNVIYRQLKESREADAEELCKWIQSITQSSSSSTEFWEGKRNMVDLRELVLKYYFNPQTKGSNSIKQVLPAVLQTSLYLKEKYSQPIYGNTIPSLNFNNHSWIIFENETVINPYELLPSIHLEASNEAMDDLLMDEEAGIADGGAAMIAYAKTQFTEMTIQERKRIQAALLRYCELDTFAMVMIYEAFREWCK